jgi:hypothetical protein
MAKTIPAHGWLNTYGDSDWLALPDNYSATGTQTLAWAVVTADEPIVAMSRWRLVNGSTYSSPFVQLQDTPLSAGSTASYTTAYAPLVVRNWTSVITGYTQWTDLFFSNPNSTSVSITITVYSANLGGGYINGQELKTMAKTIPGHGWLNTYGDSDWDLPDNSGSGVVRTLAWAVVTADEPIVAMSRWRIAPEQK